MGSLAEKWYHEGEAIGEAKGEYKKTVETARNMLTDGVQILSISKYTGLSINVYNS